MRRYSSTWLVWSGNIGQTMFLTKPIHLEWQKEERSCGILPAGQMVHGDSISCFTWWSRCWKKRRRGAACEEMKRESFLTFPSSFELSRVHTPQVWAAHLRSDREQNSATSLAKAAARSPEAGAGAEAEHQAPPGLVLAEGGTKFMAKLNARRGGSAVLPGGRGTRFHGPLLVPKRYLKRRLRACSATSLAPFLDVNIVVPHWLSVCRVPAGRLWRARHGYHRLWRWLQTPFVRTHFQWAGPWVSR